MRVFWPVDNSWYIGTVQQFNPVTGEHLLKYEDDDTEWVQIGESNTMMSASISDQKVSPMQQQQRILERAYVEEPPMSSSLQQSESANMAVKSEHTKNSDDTAKETTIGADKSQNVIAGTTSQLMPQSSVSASNKVSAAVDTLPIPPPSSYHYGSVPPSGSTFPSPGGQHHIPPHLTNIHSYPHTVQNSYSGVPPPHSSVYPLRSNVFPSSSHGNPQPPLPSSLGYGHGSQQHGMVIPQHHIPDGQPLHQYGSINSGIRMEGPSPITTGDVASASGANTGKRKTGPKAWTKEEDGLLLSIVQSMRVPMKWSLVAQNLSERTGKQCRERYVNHLNPRLKVSDWSPLEDATIFHLYDNLGSHWAKMSKIIPGRTDNGIKNRFHNLRRQLEREDEHRLRLSAARDFPEEIRLDLLREFPKKLKGKAAELWDLKAGMSVLAAQSILGGGMTRTSFGPFREAKPEGESCVRCGFLVPSVQTGKELCMKSGWCQSCARIPPHLCGNMLRECLNLRRCQDQGNRKIIESWEVPS